MWIFKRKLLLRMGGVEILCYFIVVRGYVFISMADMHPANIYYLGIGVRANFWSVV